MGVNTTENSEHLQKQVILGLDHSDSRVTGTSLVGTHCVYVTIYVIRDNMARFWNLQQSTSCLWWLPSYCNNSSVETEFIKSSHY